MTTTMKPKCAIYLRVSSTPQAEKGYSLEMQEEAGITLCQQRGWDYEIFREPGESAEKETLDNRPALQKILGLVEGKQIHYVFAIDFDRLSRHPVTTHYIKNVFKRNGVQVVTPTQTFDFSKYEDEFMADVFGAIGKLENRLRTKRCFGGLMQGVKKRGWYGGVTPFGFKRAPSNDGKHKDLVWDDEEVKWHSQVKRWKIEGKGCITIARLLNDMGVRCRRGAKWQSSTVYGALTNPLYRGIVVMDREAVKGRRLVEITDDEWERFIAEGKAVRRPDLVLISEEEWQQIKEAFHRNFKGARRNNLKYYYRLRGLLECGKCERRLFGRIATRQHSYVCSSKQPYPRQRPCGLKNVDIEKLNILVWDEVKAVVKDSKKLEAAIRNRRDGDLLDVTFLEADVKQDEKAIEDARKQQERLVREYARGIVPQELLDKNIRVLQQQSEHLSQEREKKVARLANIKSAKENLQRLENVMAKVRGRINQFTEQEIFEFLHLVVNRIIVNWDEQKKEHTIEIEGAIPIFEEAHQNLLELAQQPVQEEVTVSSRTPSSLAHITSRPR